VGTADGAAEGTGLAASAAAKKMIVTCPCYFTLTEVSTDIPGRSG
jgi:hypothetical protein